MSNLGGFIHFHFPNGPNFHSFSKWSHNPTQFGTQPEPSASAEPSALVSGCQSIF